MKAKEEKAMIFYSLKLEACYLQCASIKENEKDAIAAAQRINDLIKILEKCVYQANETRNRNH